MPQQRRVIPTPRSGGAALERRQRRAEAAACEVDHAPPVDRFDPAVLKVRHVAVCEGGEAVDTLVLHCRLVRLLPIIGRRREDAQHLNDSVERVVHRRLARRLGSGARRSPVAAGGGGVVTTRLLRCFLSRRARSPLALFLRLLLRLADGCLQRRRNSRATAPRRGEGQSRDP